MSVAPPDGLEPSTNGLTASAPGRVGLLRVRCSTTLSYGGSKSKNYLANLFLFLGLFRASPLDGLVCYEGRVNAGSNTVINVNNR